MRILNFENYFFILVSTEPCSCDQCKKRNAKGTPGKQINPDKVTGKSHACSNAFKMALHKVYHSCRIASNVSFSGNRSSV